jgi:prepilin-type N-terminal cleavage/methylation domain-containing protein/prepilin-type processing-associated H-X9-DG protein
VPITQSPIVSFLVFERPRGPKPAAHQSEKSPWTWNILAFRRGFTLLELLTVMAIISVLVAILMTALSGARERGRITKCQSNLRELASATLRYMSRHDDFFPVSADCSTGDCVFWNGHQYFGWNGRKKNPSDNTWYRPINGELGLEPAPRSSASARIAECPSDAGAPGEAGEPGALFEVLGTSYPMNPILCQGRFADWRYRGTDITSSQVLQPSRKVLVFDHLAFGLTYDGYWTAIRPGWHDRYRPAATVAFIDGHVEYLRGTLSLREWQWYGEASGPEYPRQLPQKVPWTVLPGAG